MVNSEENFSNAGNQFDWRFYSDVIFRALVLVLLCNFLYAAFRPEAFLGRLSAYNLFFPGRLRLPYSENPNRDYSLSLFSLEAMFASHEIAGKPKQVGEFRVVLIGDSSTWGFLLPPDKTLASYVNEAAIEIKDGRNIRAYNLGFPVMSLTKDLLILHEAKLYEPDLIIWPVTLESFPEDKQLSHPLLQHNPQKVRSLIDTYSLDLDKNSTELMDASFWEKTIIGSRRFLADILRLQLYGVMWAATGIDHAIPETYNPRQEDLSDDTLFHNLSESELTTHLAYDLLSGAHRIAGNVPVLLVNEPIFISQGKNSHIRYNFFYPRWAYDEYREHLHRLSVENGWLYLDLWDAVDSNQFTNSAIHMTPEGTQLFASILIEKIIDITGGESITVEEQ